MNFALLGDDPAALPLLRAIAGSSEHRLARAALAGPMERAVRELIPEAELHSDWARLLLDRELNSVIVCGTNAGVLEGARHIAAAGTALMLLPQAGQGSTFAYELALVRDDTGVLLFPVFPRRVHPLRVRLRERIEAGRFGRILHLQMEREHRPARDRGTATMSFAESDHALLLDADLLRDVGGDYDQVTALRSGETPVGIALTTVTLAGPGLPEALWRLRPAAGEPKWRLTLTGERGTAVLSGGGELSEVRLETGDENHVSEPGAAVFDVGDELLRQFEQAAGGAAFRPDWSDLTRAFEIVDASHRSVRRRRTIDLHFEETSERNQFKSHMAALGCGLLMLTLLGVVVLLIAGAVFIIPAGVMQVARVLVFLPLFVFLGLQVLVFLARPSQSRGESPSTDAAKKQE